jgi:glycosyltransferase involved in cell wall biosynthesis
MPPIPIALCITDLEIGGAERCLVNMALGMDRSRFKPVVYSLAGPYSCWVVSGQSQCRLNNEKCAEAPHSFSLECRKPALLPLLESAGVEVHCLGAQSAWQFPWIVKRLQRLLQTQRPRLAQTFLFHANIVGRIAARREGVPRVLAGIRVAERKSRWHLHLDRLTRKMVDRYVCVSRSVADFSQKQAGLPPEKLHVIPNGINVELYGGEPADLRPFGIPAGKQVATFIGRLEPQKGLSWLLESAPLWLEAAPDSHLLIVGRGPQQQALSSACRPAGISGRVHFAGFQPNIPAILSASSLLVLPSRWEGMPNVVLEAMAGRLPVVATDVEGVLELLGPGADEQTIAFGDTKALATKIVALLTNGSLCERLGSENRRRAAELFSLNRMIDAYQDLWESVLAS